MAEGVAAKRLLFYETRLAKLLPFRREFSLCLRTRQLETKLTYYYYYITITATTVTENKNGVTTISHQCRPLCQELLDYTLLPYDNENLNTI